MLRCRWIAALSLLGTAALAEPGIMLLPAIGTPKGITLTGRVLKDVPTHGSSTLSKNLRRLAASGWEGAPLTLKLAALEGKTTSGHDGDFSVRLEPKDAPLELGPSTAEAHAQGIATAVAQVEIQDPAAPFFVVSDFDDTLSVTEVVKREKLLESALLKDESTQPAVPGMAALFRCIKKLGAHPPSFALVSGSPIQYGPRIGAFLAKNGFPFLGLYLREINPDTLENYKQPVIRVLMKDLPNDVVFFGDSGEHDPEVYAQMRAEFGKRVVRTYIRDAGHSENKQRFEGDVFFHETKEAAFDAAAHKIADPTCVKQEFGESPK